MGAFCLQNRLRGRIANRSVPEGYIGDNLQSETRRIGRKTEYQTVMGLAEDDGFIK